jgi:hypothetical protein
MAKFLHLTDWKSEESIYLDPASITLIQQIAGDEGHPRRTRIDTTRQTLVVREDADFVALAINAAATQPLASDD